MSLSRLEPKSVLCITMKDAYILQPLLVPNMHGNCDAIRYSGQLNDFIGSTIDMGSVVDVKQRIPLYKTPQPSLRPVKM